MSMENGGENRIPSNIVVSSYKIASKYMAIGLFVGFKDLGLKGKISPPNLILVLSASNMILFWGELYERKLKIFTFSS